MISVFDSELRKSFGRVDVFSFASDQIIKGDVS